MLKKILTTASIILITYNSYAAGFHTISNADWDEGAVRRVLHAFAYGGQTNEKMIIKLAKMSPQAAIKKMLTFSKSNGNISKRAKIDAIKLAKKTNGSLRGLGEFWSSDDSDNDVPENKRQKYSVALGTNVRPAELWLRATVSHGLNPFRQKVGIWETNYHMAVNIKSSINPQQMLTYYDDVVKSLGNIKRAYHKTLTIAATSAAVAEHYGHRNNVYKNDVCLCNEDFAREYFQLFFGILGEDPDYHEEITIKNTAKALTDMKIESVSGQGRVDHVTFGTEFHTPGTLDILYSLNKGRNALKRIKKLSKVAMYYHESRDNLPVIIINGLADDNLSDADIAEIRAAWSSMKTKNLLSFLRAYAISTQFHNASRVKYLTSIDRRMLINTQFILNNAEIDRYSLPAYLREEQAYPFEPVHNVFGGQTGKEAANSSDIFRAHYNSVTEKNYVFLKVAGSGSDTWRKDWASVLSKKLSIKYEVDKIGEFLWDRFIGDGLKNYATLERAYVNSLLASGKDLAYAIDANDLDRIFTTNELETDVNLISLLEDFASTKMALKSKDDKERQAANRNVGLAISFILGTPYLFAREGR
jgi:hypothetical protein